MGIMISIPCRKCGSITIRKNGKTENGDQKYHCKACGFYGTLATHEEKQKKNSNLQKNFSVSGFLSAGCLTGRS